MILQDAFAEKVDLFLGPIRPGEKLPFEQLVTDPKSSPADTYSIAITPLHATACQMADPKSFELQSPASPDHDCSLSAWVNNRRRIMSDDGEN